jgi:predicted phosphodiesterase
MPRLVCISDTHELHNNLALPEGDILIHAGDWTYVGAPKAVCNFIDWFSSQPHKHKIFIAGNHEITLDDSLSLPKAFLARRFGLEGDFNKLRKTVTETPSNVHYLLDREIQIEGLRIYGSPWQPSFGGWAFNRERGPSICEKWKLIPCGIDVLITHGPAYGKLDSLDTSERVGCVDLLQEIQDRVRPKVHVFGHIHHSYGMQYSEGTTYINASSCGEDYTIKNKPIVYDL